MKKPAFLVITLILLGAAALQGAQLKILQPNGGESLALGSTYLIKWSATGVNEEVRLVLLKGGTSLGIIASDLDPASGQYLWTVGRYLGGVALAGQDYKVRIRTDGGTAGDASDGFFSLKTASFASGLQVENKLLKLKKIDPKNLGQLARVIVVKTPLGGGQYLAGQPLAITWDKEIGITGYLAMALLDEQGAVLETKGNILNTGSYNGWIPDSKYTWPGTKYRIRLTITNAGNSQQASGLSGLFSIVPPAPKVERTLARNGETETTQTREYHDNGRPECLSAPHPAPGRQPGSREIKVGHHVVSGRHGECDWYEAYYFQGHVRFDLEEIVGKEIVEAKLLVSLSGFQQLTPQGDVATNEECDHHCDVYIRDGGSNLAPTTSFSIFSEGDKKTLDVTDAVRHWAGGGTNSGLLFRAKLDHSQYANSICLKYYGTLFLTVKYMD